MYVEEESIYSLLPPQQEVPTRPPRFVSKHSGRVDPKTLSFGQDKVQLHATMGLPNGCNAQHPRQYLRSHEKAPVLPDPQAPSNPKHKSKGPVPRRDEPPVFGLTSNKNFITTNAVDVILSKPKRVPQEEFNWTARPGFGSVPVYLKRNKARIAEEREQFETYLRLRHQPAEDQRVSQLSPDERADLLRHLKVKWASVNDAFQKQPLSTDTEQKKHRKEELARTLAELEKDIKTLERGETVLVVDE